MNVADEKEPEAVQLGKMTDEELRQVVKVKLAKFVCACCDHPDRMTGGQAQVLPAVAKTLLHATDGRAVELNSTELARRIASSRQHEPTRGTSEG